MLEFRAGKMRLEGTRVVPDARKGLVRIARGEEGLMHFQWLDRTLNVLEDDQIIFPEEAVFEKVNQASGRVYILKFNSDDRKFFFWMQEPNAEGDAQLCNSVNFYINQPIELPDDDDGPEETVPLQDSEDMVFFRSGEDIVEDDISSRAGPGLTAEATDKNIPPSAGAVSWTELKRILSSIEPGDNAGDPDGGFGLGDILKPDLIMPLICTLPVEERLASYLPEGEWSPEEIMELFQSPPFRQQVDSFSYVLRTGQIDLSQFEIDSTKYKFTVLSFLEALEDSVSKSSDSDDSRHDDKNLRSQSCNHNDPMDEAQ